MYTFHNKEIGVHLNGICVYGIIITSSHKLNIEV